MIGMKQNVNDDQVGDNYRGKYLLITTLMMMMMPLRGVKKEPISMTMNQGRSGRSKYLPTVADNDQNDTDFVANCHKLSTNFCQRKWTILMRIY